MLIRACTLALIAFVFAGEAAASELIGCDGGTRRPPQVNGAGQAHVTWSENGTTRHLVAGNAINARPPRPTVPQVSFRLRYGPSSDSTARAAAATTGRRSRGWSRRARHRTARTGRCSAGSG